MNRLFYSLPDPEQAGLEWRVYEEKRERIQLLEQRRREAAEKAQALEQRIRELERGDVRSLAEALFRGESDPAASLDDLAELGAELRENRRLTEALSEALPRAEEALRQAVFADGATWIPQADKVLQECIEAEWAAYAKAQEIAQEARAKRQYAEALARWARNPSPTFGASSDPTIRSSIEQTWVEDLDRCERQMQEREHNEQLQAREEFEKEAAQVAAGGGAG